MPTLLIWPLSLSLWPFSLSRPFSHLPHPQPQIKRDMEAALEQDATVYQYDEVRFALQIA